MLESVPDSSLYVDIILFSVSLVGCALFSFLETSITTLRLYKLQELSKASSRYEKLFQSLEQNQSRVLTTILVANNLVNVIAATAGTLLAEKIFKNLPESVGLPLGIVFTTAAILFVGEVIPKNIAQAMGDRLFKYTLWITNVTCYLFSPVVWIFLRISNYMIYKIKGMYGKPEDEVITSEKEIRFLIDYINKKGLLEEEKTNMLKSIFELGTTSVKDILIPATEVISVNAHISVTQALDVFKTYQFSRLPVYENRVDNIIGMLHLKDLFSMINKEDKPIKDMLRPIMFVPDSVKVNQLLKEFKEQHMHIAMVLNEHGSIVGLVTLADVLAEIVGEIKDEHKERVEKISALKENVWLVDAGMSLKELAGYLNITFETESALTLGGFLTEQLQHMPKKGNRVAYKGYYFQVQQASQRRAIKILIFSEHNSPHPNLQKELDL